MKARTVAFGFVPFLPAQAAVQSEQARKNKQDPQQEEFR